MSWTEDVVDRLGALKLTGMSHEHAWKIAVGEYPPRGRDRGPAVPSFFGEEECLVDFVYRATADAWYGRRPDLGYLESALAVAGSDWFVPVRRGATSRPMAAA